MTPRRRRRALGRNWRRVEERQRRRSRRGRRLRRGRARRQTMELWSRLAALLSIFWWEPFPLDFRDLTRLRALIVTGLS